MKNSQAISLDAIDRASYNPGPSPLDSPADVVDLKPGRADHPAGATRISLDGAWEMAYDGEMRRRILEEWPDAIQAQVPGSVHSALVKSGIIPDPTFGKFDAIAREHSFKTYYYKRTFTREQADAAGTLVFDGVALNTNIFLNGKHVGYHEGMFGSFAYETAPFLRDGDNTLVVEIKPAPYKPSAGSDHNDGWQTTVTFNNVYGWHYSNIPSLGIWRSVRLEAQPAVKMISPFVATRDAAAGVVDLVVKLKGSSASWSGSLRVTVEPENFEGKPYHFERSVRSESPQSDVHLQFVVPDPQLWWPNDMGNPSLYRMTLSFVPDGAGRVADLQTTTFGIRTIEMASLPGGPHADKYDWKFIVNKRPMFVKGNGWCTMDPLMNFSRERYDWFLSLAAAQHGQMIRAWGSGMPETDDFYDLCDRKGIMIFQEWPTAWNSHQKQPYGLLEETVHQNTLRIRNHPSLALLSGGNESDRPFGPAIDMMGRAAVELDGTRAFHRGEAWGGSLHNYDAYWGQQHPDHNLTMTSHFWGEFGVACMPVFESVMKYLPESERNVWPLSDNSVFAHHTPTFNADSDMVLLFGAKKDMALQKKYAGYFTSGATMQRFIMASQMSQAVGLRHTLERSRTRWPECTGSLYYKMNDNYPAASWSTADWYGAPKMGHYFCQDAYSPLHACVLFEKLDNTGERVAWPVFVLDDTDELRDSSWQVNVRAFDGRLKQITASEISGKGSIENVKKAGDFSLNAAQTNTNPLLIVVDMIKEGKIAGRTFYWLNYEPVKDCLFELPRTALRLVNDGKSLTVTNTGNVPAVAVYFTSPEHSESFAASDGYFWLDPSESKTVTATRYEGITASALNADSV